MREKELRLALVCFGGISLAIYMHGISKEILKLVRASAALHAISDRARRGRASFFDSADPSDPEYCTESVYFELLREIGLRRIELRVIVDIIAGASAGGINGTMLARALAHDLPMGRLRDLWLEKADVTVLLAREARAKAWSKWFLKPLIWGFSYMRLFKAVKDAEVRRKLSLFVRSRWFRPPLDGLCMAELMYDGVAAMGEPRHPTASLMPAGHRLDLFVMLTDFYGYHRLVQIHDPALIGEREHRHILHFGYRRRPGGETETDFDLPNAPALAFAARATSSFPGVFPAAQIGEIDRMVARKGVDWSRRAAFLAGNFERYAQTGHDPQSTSFIDGGVLNNKPFREAIQAIKDRPAYRQVDRRLVYVDPDPSPPSPQASGRPPGLFLSLKGALSDIPRNEPIADELSWVASFNERVRRLKSVVEAARPHVAKLVADIATTARERPFTVEEIRGWREEVNARVARENGFAYEGYVRLKLGSVRAFVSHLIAILCHAPPGSLAARVIGEVVDAWALVSGANFDARDSHALHLESSDVASGLPSWVQFLLAFDLDYRKRRLHFLIQGQNRLYQVLEGSHEERTRAVVVDRLKRDFYQALEALRQRESESRFSPETRALARALFAHRPSVEEARHIADYAKNFAASNRARILALLERMAREIDLDATTHDVDALLAAMDPAAWSRAARQEVLVNYLGFPFWDVLTLSVTNWRDAVEFNEILIDRISPEDSRMIDGFAGWPGLKGVAFGHFGAFLSRAYRENDYLLGRLQAADRLIDIVCDSAGIDPARDEIDVLRFKRLAMERILDVEERHLPQSAALIAALRNEIAKLGGDGEAPDRAKERAATT